MRTNKLNNSLLPALAVVSLLCNQARAFLPRHQFRAPLQSEFSARAHVAWRESLTLSSTGLIRVPYRRVPSFFQAAGNGMIQTASILRSMQDLAKRSTHGTLNTAQRFELSGAFQSSLLRLNEHSLSVHFGHHLLLDGSRDALLQGAPPANIELIVDLPNQTILGLGLSGSTIDLTSVSNAIAVLTQVNTALVQVQKSRAALLDSVILIGAEPEAPKFGVELKPMPWVDSNAPGRSSYVHSDRGVAPVR